MKKIAINGFGRIGKTFLRTVLADANARKKLSIAVINIGTGDLALVGHLFKYDTLMGTFPLKVEQKGDTLIIDGCAIKIIAQTDPLKINWLAYEIDWVVDCSGKFTHRQDAQKHLEAGAKAVLISAPAHDEDVAIIPGVNDAMFDAKKHTIVSLGSCTTNALFPLLKVIDDHCGIAQAQMTTTHAYTNSQVLLDIEAKDARMSRAAALNIIPGSTGAAKMVKKIMPALDGRIAMISMRVPVDKVSLIQLTFCSNKSSSLADLGNAFQQAAHGPFKSIITVSKEPLVSSDFSGNSSSVIVDALMTAQVDRLYTIFGWYDNEWGYSCRLRDFLLAA